MAGNKHLTRQRHKDVRDYFAKLSKEGVYKYDAVIKKVAEKYRYTPWTVERIVCTSDDQIKDDGTLKLF